MREVSDVDMRDSFLSLEKSIRRMAQAISDPSASTFRLRYKR